MQARSFHQEESSGLQMIQKGRRNSKMGKYLTEKKRYYKGAHS